MDTGNKLDKKLEEVLNDTYSAGALDPDLEMYGINDAEVKEIKQAFTNEGYTKIDQRRYRDDKGRSYQQYTFNGGYVRVPEFVVMTGQEWYDRFEKEMDNISAYATFDNHNDVDRALAAAKKAAGIE